MIIIILILILNHYRKKELGGSAILDIGIYTLNFAQYVFKEEPIKITAVGEVNDEGVDVVETVVLEYSRNRRAVLNVNSRIKLWNRATVYGESGRITVSLLKVKNIIQAIKAIKFHINLKNNTFIFI